MKRTICLAVLLLGTACERDASERAPASKVVVENKAATPPERSPMNVPAREVNAPVPAEVAHAAPDNTAKNERDRQPAALTPGDQGGSEADRSVTQRVRQGVVGNDAISMTGKNVKIITVDGVVTLRGPVKTAQEKSQIAAIAKGVSGVKSVDNQLEVAVN